MMRDATKRDLTPELRARFAELSDYLIPEFENMPAASRMDVSGKQLNAVIKARPDLIPALVRGIRASEDMTAKEALQHIYDTDAEAFDAISSAASGGYYMHPEVRELLNYPGQESIEMADPYETPSYVNDGSLMRVFKRGPVYVPTPGQEPKSHEQLLGKSKA